MRMGSLGTLWRFEPRRIAQVWYHLPNFLRLFWRLLHDRRVPLWPKMILVLVLAYVFAPIDFLPDFLPALGQIDDLAVIFLGLKGFIRLCPKEVVREHVQAIAARR